MQGLVHDDALSWLAHEATATVHEAVSRSPAHLHRAAVGWCVETLLMQPLRLLAEAGPGGGGAAAGMAHHGRQQQDLVSLLQPWEDRTYLRYLSDWVESLERPGGGSSSSSSGSTSRSGGSSSSSGTTATGTGSGSSTGLVVDLAAACLASGYVQGSLVNWALSRLQVWGLGFGVRGLGFRVRQLGVVALAGLAAGRRGAPSGGGQAVLVYGAGPHRTAGVACARAPKPLPHACVG